MLGLTKRASPVLLVTKEQKVGVYKHLNASLAYKYTSVVVFRLLLNEDY